MKKKNSRNVINCFDIRVGFKTLDRAIQIIDKTIKTFENYNFNVFIENDEDLRGTYVNIYEEKVSFHIRESKNFKSGILNNNLNFKISEYWPSNVRKLWRDGRKLKLEDKINEFIISSIIIADIRRKYRIQNERSRVKYLQEFYQHNNCD